MPNFTGLWTPTQQLQAKSLGVWPALPGAPTSVVATAGNTQASVAFTAPADTGFPAGAITSFTATSSPGGFTASGASSPLTVVGLTNDTAYTFTVTATNASGTGPASSASNSVTPVVPPSYVEDVFSTFVGTGNGSTQTITNGIDLAGKGGLVWLKARSIAYANFLIDTVRGRAKPIRTDATDAEGTSVPGYDLTSFNSNGFSLGPDWVVPINTSNNTFVSWTFRKQPKFFDVVTWTGNYPTNYPRVLSHSLGSTPGFVIIKRTDGVGAWQAWHRSVSTGDYNANQTLFLNTTAAAVNYGNQAGPFTSTTITVGENLNQAGQTFVAYLFAHDAGGFGLTGTDNVISCGSFTTTTSADTINLGYEPQWLLIKAANSVTNWYIFDNMRGIPTGGNDSRVNPNLVDAEQTDADYLSLTATGFTSNFQSIFGDGINLIYMAIRRGPMKVPTLGTSVFSPTAANNPLDTKNTTNFPIDLQIGKYRNIDSNNLAEDRLRGISTTSTSSGRTLRTNTTNAEDSVAWTRGWDNTGFLTPVAYADTPTILWNFRRAPGFFDEVCWTGNNSTNQRVSHNLGVVPELIIYKGRNKVNYWRVYFGSINTYIQLNADIAAVSGSNFWGSSAPTTTNFGINCGSMDLDNFDAVAYLFATCPGVSKVGTYTGNGTNYRPIECGFTTGARFVLLKRTDTTGNWFVFDTARGIISGPDRILYLNTPGAEIISDEIGPYAGGFTINQNNYPCNVSGGTYIFLAIA